MIHDPLNRLFPSDLPDESVDLLFDFLHQLTDTFFEVYEEQIVRIAQPQARDHRQPPDIDDCDFDDEIPW